MPFAILPFNQIATYQARHGDNIGHEGARPSDSRRAGYRRLGIDIQLSRSDLSNRRQQQSDRPQRVADYAATPLLLYKRTQFTSVARPRQMMAAMLMRLKPRGACASGRDLSCRPPKFASGQAAYDAARRGCLRGEMVSSRASDVRLRAAIAVRCSAPWSLLHIDGHVTRRRRDDRRLALRPPSPPPRKKSTVKSAAAARWPIGEMAISSRS